MPKPKRHIIYEGPSLIEGKPIVVVATQQSNNLKTGNMIQTYILRADMDPIAANQYGEDYSICGSCDMRGEPTDDPGAMSVKKRACYVVLKRDPLAVYNHQVKVLYKPNFSNQRAVFDTQFAGTTIAPFTYEKHEKTLVLLVKKIHVHLTDNDRAFLLSFHAGARRCRGAPGLPAIQGTHRLPWKDN